MKRLLMIGFISLTLLNGCASVTPPDDFTYYETQTRTFKLASWQKITNPNAPYKFYIEGDGYAFNRRGYPTDNPTPCGTFMREIAFNDPSPNVIYLARPCQYVSDDFCAQRHWTTARFAPEVIHSTTEIIQQIAPNQELILIGYSGGAQVAGLIAATQQNLQIKKLITIAGNLDHEAWTNRKNLYPLSESMSLESYQTQYAAFPQTHYVGGLDTVIPPEITQTFVFDPNNIVFLPSATHGTGFESVYPQIWDEH